MKKLEKLLKTGKNLGRTLLSAALASSLLFYSCKGPNILYPDTTSPVLTLVGENSINLPVGSTYTELGARATDNVDGDLTSKIIISGAIDVNTPGLYTITYNVSDTAGNPSHITRVINVFEPPEIPPVLVEKIFLSSNRTGNFDIYMVNPDGSDLEQLTDTPENEFFISISRDGKNMAYSVYSADSYLAEEIFIMNTDKLNQNPMQLTDNDSFDGFPVFSYDGKDLFFGSSQNGNTDIYKINLDNKTLAQVTNTLDESEIPLGISPDGKKLLFASIGNEETYSLSTINSDGTSEIPTRLIEGLIDIPYASYSPDGSMIAFNSFYEVQDPYDPNRSFIHSNIEIMASDGKNPSTLIGTDDYDEFFLIWSPNGTELGYSAYSFTDSGEYGTSDVYIKNSIYTRNLTDSLAEDIAWAWERIPSY